MTFRLLPVVPAQIARVAGAGALIALIYCYLLGRYWAFYHLSVGGGFVFIVLVPVSVTVGVVLGVASTIALAWRGIPGRRGAPMSVALLVAMAVFALGSEIHRTEPARSGEGEGAGDLAPFFRSLVELP